MVFEFMQNGDLADLLRCRTPEPLKLHYYTSSARSKRMALCSNSINNNDSIKDQSGGSGVGGEAKNGPSSTTNNPTIGSEPSSSAKSTESEPTLTKVSLVHLISAHILTILINMLVKCRGFTFSILMI